MARSGSSAQNTKSQKLKQDVVKAKEGKAQQQQKKGGRKAQTDGKDTLKEQVLALGGDKEDLALLNGVRDDELVQGEQTADVRLSSGFMLLNYINIRINTHLLPLHIARARERCIEVLAGPESRQGAQGECYT